MLVCIVLTCYLLFISIPGESCLEYNVTLLKLMESLEEKMEQDFFSPPLSKQRVEYTLRLIAEAHAESLVLYLLIFGLEYSF